MKKKIKSSLLLCASLLMGVSSSSTYGVVANEVEGALFQNQKSTCKIGITNTTNYPLTLSFSGTKATVNNNYNYTSTILSKQNSIIGIDNNGSDSIGNIKFSINGDEFSLDSKKEWKTDWDFVGLCTGTAIMVIPWIPGLKCTRAAISDGTMVEDLKPYATTEIVEKHVQMTDYDDMSLIENKFAVLTEGETLKLENKDPIISNSYSCVYIKKVKGKYVIFDKNKEFLSITPKLPSTFSVNILSAVYKSRVISYEEFKPEFPYYKYISGVGLLGTLIFAGDDIGGVINSESINTSGGYMTYKIKKEKGNDITDNTSSASAVINGQHGKYKVLISTISTPNSDTNNASLSIVISDLNDNNSNSFNDFLSASTLKSLGGESFLLGTIDGKLSIANSKIPEAYKQLTNIGSQHSINSICSDGKDNIYFSTGDGNIYCYNILNNTTTTIFDSLANGNINLIEGPIQSISQLHYLPGNNSLYFFYSTSDLSGSNAGKKFVRSAGVPDITEQVIGLGSYDLTNHKLKLEYDGIECHISNTSPDLFKKSFITKISKDKIGVYFACGQLDGPLTTFTNIGKTVASYLGQNQIQPSPITEDIVLTISGDNGDKQISDLKMANHKCVYFIKNGVIILKSDSKEIDYISYVDKKKSVFNDPTNSIITSLYVTIDGIELIGTKNNGLFCVDPATGNIIYHIGGKDSQSQFNASIISIDGNPTDGDITIGLDNGDILLYRPLSNITYTIKYPHITSYIRSSIVEDGSSLGTPVIEIKNLTSNDKYLAYNNNRNIVIIDGNNTQYSLDIPIPDIKDIKDGQISKLVINGNKLIALIRVKDASKNKYTELYIYDLEHIANSKVIATCIYSDSKNKEIVDIESMGIHNAIIVGFSDGSMGIMDLNGKIISTISGENNDKYLKALFDIDGKISQQYTDDHLGKHVYSEIANINDLIYYVQDGNSLYKNGEIIQQISPDNSSDKLEIIRCNNFYIILHENDSHIDIYNTFNGTLYRLIDSINSNASGFIYPNAGVITSISLDQKGSSISLYNADKVIYTLKITLTEKGISVQKN